MIERANTRRLNEQIRATIDIADEVFSMRQNLERISKYCSLPARMKMPREDPARVRRVD